MGRSDIERQAKLIAREGRRSEPEILRTFWFPDDNEVRLVELHSTILGSADGEVHPFYFPPSLDDDLPARSGIALIRPDEYRKLRLPREWGDWDMAIELDVNE